MRLKIIPSFILLALAAGCASDALNQPTAKELGLEHWNATRSAVLLSLARDQYASGSFDKCRQTLNQALRTDPNNPAVHVFLAKVSIEQGQLDQAEQELDTVRAIDKDLDKKPTPSRRPSDQDKASEPQPDPTEAQADYLSGVIYQRWQQPEKALEFYESAYEKAPTEQAYLMAKAETLVSLGRQGEALDLLQTKVVYFEHSPVIRDGVGMLLLQAHRAGEAADMFRRASILAPDDLSVREHLAIALFQDKQYAEAAEIFQNLLGNDALSKRCDLRLELAECQLSLGRAASARASAQAACELDPSLPYAWVTLAKISLSLNDLHQAETSLNRAQDLDPDSAEAQLLMGYLRLRQNRLSEALDRFQQASQLDSSDSTSLCMIGYVLQQLGRPRQAAQYYQQALKLDPKDKLAGELMADVSGE